MRRGGRVEVGVELCYFDSNEWNKLEVWVGRCLSWIEVCYSYVLVSRLESIIFVKDWEVCRGLSDTL